MDLPRNTTLDRLEVLGAVDPTLFIWQAGNDLLLMTTEFKMSMMGQMSFFLGLQISQSPRGIFINQSKYASEIVKKYGIHTTDSVDMPMVEKRNMDEDLQGKLVDATLYHGIIGPFYILHPVDLTLYMQSAYVLGLWYSKDIDMSLTAYLHADHAGCQDTRRSTPRNTQFLGEKLVRWLSKKQKSTTILRSDDGVTTLFQLSQNSRPPCLIIKEKYMMKAQVHVSKSSAISDVQALPQKKHY
nr:hypothetical protein [Tanacetum cinerariifolium]